MRIKNDLLLLTGKIHFDKTYREIVMERILYNNFMLSGELTLMISDITILSKVRSILYDKKLSAISFYFNAVFHGSARPLCYAPTILSICYGYTRGDLRVARGISE
jgi:hypothetical protein